MLFFARSNSEATSQNKHFNFTIFPFSNITPRIILAKIIFTFNIYKMGFYSGRYKLFCHLQLSLEKLSFLSMLYWAMLKYHIFTKENVVEIINLQPLKDGKAKPYQVKQVRNLFLKYKFHLEER